MLDVKIMNRKDDCVEEQEDVDSSNSNMSENDSKEGSHLTDVNGEKNIVPKAIDPEMGSDDLSVQSASIIQDCECTKETNCEEDNEGEGFLKKNIIEEDDSKTNKADTTRKEQLEINYVREDGAGACCLDINFSEDTNVSNKTDESQCCHDEHLDNPIKVQLEGNNIHEEDIGACCLQFNLTEETNISNKTDVPQSCYHENLNNPLQVQLEDNNIHEQDIGACCLQFNLTEEPNISNKTDEPQSCYHENLDNPLQVQLEDNNIHEEDIGACCLRFNLREESNVSNTIDESQCCHDENLDNPIQVHLEDSDIRFKRICICMQPHNRINAPYVEEEGARRLENNIARDVMNDEACAEILNINNRILEIFPDVEEIYLLNLCFECSKRPGDTMEIITEILMRGDYPINAEMQKYYVSKIKAVLPVHDDELLGLLASTIKTDDELNRFMNEIYETEIKEPDQKLMFNCPCCCEEHLELDAMVDCSNGCYSCKNCVVRNFEIMYGEGFVRMDCLTNCGGKYIIGQLQDFMNPVLFARIGTLLQQREIEKAQIDNLQRCPFCDYAAITEEVVFDCTQCKKNSCLLCKKESHPTLTCDQVEDDDDVRKRTYVENELAEALFRTCPKCKVKIIKEVGCNKITCSCGTMLCYVCKAIVLDYKHFNGEGGSNYHLCPLFNDTKQMHASDVRTRARTVMKEVGGNLKIDPTANLD